MRLSLAESLDPTGLSKCGRVTLAIQTPELLYGRQAADFSRDFEPEDWSAIASLKSGVYQVMPEAAWLSLPEVIQRFHFKKNPVSARALDQRAKKALKEGRVICLH